MSGVLIALVVVAVLVLLGLALSVRIVQQYEKGVLFRLGRVVGVREPGLRLIVPLVEVLRRVSLRIVTMPIQSQGIITRDNVSIDVAGVAYYHVTDAVRSVVAIENVPLEMAKGFPLCRLLTVAVPTEKPIVVAPGESEAITTS